MSRRMTKPTKWPVRPAKTQIRLGICPVWLESSLSAHWVAADSEDWSDEADAQPDMSLCLAHRSFCWFCHAVALSHILEFMTFFEEEKKYLPTYQPFSRVRGNKDIFKGGPDIAMQHQFSKLKAVL